MRYTQDEINNIVDNASVLDYFLYLEKIGKVKFERKTGHDYYFRTDTNKFSVSEKRWYDYKTQIGGGAVKAVMALENKTWKETIDFLKDFNHIPLDRDLSERKANWKKQGEQKANIEIQKTLKPNNGNLIDYFAERGIERDILEKYTEQIHYKTNDKYYFGIGLKNESGGYEIRNPYAKTKIGTSDISIIKGERTDELMVFEGMTDMLSFLQMQKNKGLQTKRNLVILNSVTNTNKFLERYKDFPDKVFLALDKDDAGDLATKQIIEGLSNSKIKDIRQILGLEYKQDLNDFVLKNFDINKNTSKLAEGFKAIQNSTGTEYIINKHWEKENKLWVFEKPKNELDLYVSKNIEFKYSNLKELFNKFSFQDLDGNNLVLFNDDTIIIQQKHTYNEQNTTQSTGVSSPITMGGTPLEPNIGRDNTTSKSQQTGDHPSRQGMDSHNAGNGLGTSEQFDLGGGAGQRAGTPADPQPKNDEIPHLVREEESRQIGDSVGLREGTDGRPSGNKDRVTGENDTGHHRDNSGGSILPHRANATLRGRLTNEQITELINSVTEISDRKEINIKAGASIEVKDAASQYKSGGITKDGRGILDEYYTDHAIVNTVRNLIKDHFKGKTEISVLEPSVGTGNFLQITKDLGLKTNITAFEINETTARISKVLYPNANIHLRSFESEFITENGQPKDFSEQYDLVIGNPPYGQHRGYYKGLGEESKISRYEDYFVKRSLDVLKEGGTLAMVLPSGWLNRQNKLANAELTNAYRLPTGAFKGTQIGTDIIILKKNSQAQIQDISNYFKENNEKVLGEVATKTNQWAKEVEYVKGSLDDALVKIQSLIKLNEKKELKKTEQIGDLWGDWLEEDNIIQEQSPIFSKYDTEFETQLETTKQQLSIALDTLNGMKFKSLAIKNKITHYTDLQKQLNEQENTFTLDDLKEISEKAGQTIKISNNVSAHSEYLTQNKPNIKKGILKYQFSKQDEIVETGLQNSPNLTEEKLLSFQQTSYNGQIGVHESRLMKYANVYKGDLYHDFYYTEGDIYEKLEQLDKDFSKKIDWLGSADEQQKQYDKQKALLESVLPPRKALEDIIISPNHEFVHQFSLGQKEKTIQVPDGVDPFTGKQRYAWEKQMANYSLADHFQEFVRSLPSEAFGKSSAWEVNAFVRNENVTGSDRERNALIRERRKEVANDLFKKFIHEELSDDLKERFVNEFNRKYNNIHIPDYTQFPLFSHIHQNFKGKPLKLTEIQKAGIGRLTTKGVGLLAHEVGFGKTLSGILSMHEAMERGNAKRPLIVVPNDSILKQWVETIFETIPNAKVNVLGNLGKGYDLSKFDNKDGEITLVTYEGFNSIGFSRETTQRLASSFSYISENEMKTIKNTTTGIDVVRHLTNLKSEREIQKELQKKKELQGKMKKGKIYDWEDFGFDHLTFDEVHNANHIVGKVKIEDRSFASDFRNQQQRTSKLGLNTWVAAQYIQEQNNGRNVTLLSATPFTNKPLEYYSILSLIANDRLEKSDYFNVNNFFETFMEADTEMEIDAKGDIKNKTNVRRFKNNDLFQKLLSEFVDIKGEEDNPELKRPNRINKEYKIEQNKLTEDMYFRLNNLFDEEQKGAVLTHILNARKIAFSPYLYEEYDGEEPNTKEFIENSPKLKTTMDLITQNKKDKPEAGQIIYSELGVSEFPKLKEYLVSEVGYKADEVAIITGATNKNQRLNIQEKFNEGKIKIVIGSEAIQEGINLQQNTTDMYLLTLPYNFTSLRQTEGRAWRQGNKWENVRINFMLTNDSIDVFMLQKLQAKQSRYMKAMKDGANIIDVADVDTQELKTAIITDPYTRADIEIKLLEKIYEAEKSRYSADLGFISRKFDKFLNSDEYKRVIDIQKNIKNYTKWAEDDDYYKEQLKIEKEYLITAEIKLKTLVENLNKQGVNISEFEQQKQKIKIKIEELDKKIVEELPLIKQNLITQYKQEKEERLKNTSQIDFVQERAEENKTFFKLAPTEKEKVAERKKIQQEEMVKNMRKR